MFVESGEMQQAFRNGLVTYLDNNQTRVPQPCQCQPAPAADSYVSPSTCDTSAAQ